MTNRREFLRTAAAATAGGVVTGGAAAASPLPLPLHAVLIETTFPQTHAFGASLATAASAPLLHLRQGDITAAWLQHIAPIWQREPVALAGLTLSSSLFCLETLTSLTPLRVQFHAEHVLLPDGRVQHRVLRGGDSAQLNEDHLHRLGPLWPTHLADAVAVHRRADSRQRLGPSVAALTPSLPDGASLLTSWIIAPV
ncbi:MAG: hypothetical protein LBE59_05340 [Nevskiaceae bacterium]|jgi:hypothetical protein|nr:hypothetical protein [Nevskiaceae bacterium]